MKKILTISFLILSLVITGCLGTRKITIEAGEDEIVSCPKRAKPGETVTIETVIVNDADLYLFVNGIALDPIKEGFYQFEMPNQDVRIKVVVKSNGLA